MKRIKLILAAIVSIGIAACHSSKKITAPASGTATVAKSADGIYPPGNEELTAIQVKYKDVTLDQLKEGYLLYTKGACINCHGAQNIYRYGEVEWARIIEDMAWKAKIMDDQKDAVYKYVLAIKATQPG